MARVELSYFLSMQKYINIFSSVLFLNSFWYNFCIFFCFLEKQREPLLLKYYSCLLSILPVFRIYVKKKTTTGKL